MDLHVSQLQSDQPKAGSCYSLKVGTLITDSESPVLENQIVTISHNVIESIQTEKAFLDNGGREYFDATDYIVCPGLINSHTHVAMGFFRGLGTDVHKTTQDQSMIETFLFPAEKSLTPELVRDLSYSYIVEGIKSGVTTFFDHYYFSQGVGEALMKVGARGFIAETVADLGGAFPSRDSWQRARELIANWPFDTDLIRPVIGPHACDTVSKELLSELSQFARSHDLPVHLHCSQTIGERQRVFARYKCSPVQLLERCGILNEKTLVVHLVSASGDDLKLLADSGATGVYCPTSQILYENSADINSWRDHKLVFTIATDCAASNDACDVLQECKLTNLMLRHARGQSAHMSSSELLRAVTRQPAKVVGAENELGLIREGAKADMLFIKKDLSLLPIERVFNNLIYSHGAAFIEHVIINGRFVLKNRRLVSCDEEQVTEIYNKACQNIYTQTKKND